MRIIFWNVDTQYDFMRDDNSFKGALPVPGARKIEKNLETLTNAARKYNLQIVNTADWHTRDSKEFSKNPDYKTTFPEHCLQGTKGARFVPATKPLDAYIVDWQKSYDERELAYNVLNSKETVIYKDAFDVFEGNPYTQEIVGLLAPSKVIIYGVAANVCVDFAVKGLLNPLFGIKEIYVVEDAIKGLPNLPLEETINGWKEKGVRLIKARDVKKYCLD